MDHCLAPDLRMGGLGCDNMTAILICCLNSEPYSKLVTKCSRLTTTHSSQINAHHSWAHKRNCALSDSGEISEEGLTYGVSPRSSKLNDTVSGANTDLDSELASSKQRNNGFPDVFVTQYSPLASQMTQMNGKKQSTSSSSEEGGAWEDEEEEEEDAMTIEMDTTSTPIETMV